MNQKLKTLIIGSIVCLGLIIIPILISSFLLNSPVLASPVQEKLERVEIIDNLGSYHYPISTSSDLAQKYFDQGLIQSYSFNDAEAARAFSEASRLDPNCAMCYWGLAYALEPSIKALRTNEQVPEAWQAIQQAITLSNNASPKEQALIKALAQRYSEQPVADRSSLDLAYAQAMKQVFQDYPDDLDAATLYALSLMYTIPWDYWQDNGEIKPEAKPMLETFESVLARNPQHPGATHFYIHAVEKEKPILGIQTADNLRNAFPGSGHLEHMPSHIYIRVGRYQDAVIANQKAIIADLKYLASPHPESIYTMAFVPHNYNFLWFAAVMSGQSEIAMEAAQQTAAVAQNLMGNPSLSGMIQYLSVLPLYTEVRFGKWDKILETPAPTTDMKYATGVWHYARGMAFTSQGQKEKANQELAKLQVLIADSELEELIISWNSVASVLKIATEVLTGSIATLEPDYTTAISHFQKAIALEDQLAYTELPDWDFSPRNLLGTILLQVNQPEKAEQAFRDDLEIYPNNGWSLHGLAQSLEAQGKTAEAETVQKQYQQAWQYADIAL